MFRIFRDLTFSNILKRRMLGVINGEIIMSMDNEYKKEVALDDSRTVSIMCCTGVQAYATWSTSGNTATITFRRIKP